jgi:hypothetical protein
MTRGEQEVGGNRGLSYWGESGKEDGESEKKESPLCEKRLADARLLKV